MMKVKLFSYTQQCDEFFEECERFSRTQSELIAYCARVSNPSTQVDGKGGDKLIKYLIKNQHWSPFEMVNVCLEVETTRDIARQILRHRSFSFQEFSQRYASVESFGPDAFVIREARLQDEKNRQSSIEVFDPELQAEWAKRQQSVIDLSRDNYLWALDRGIAKEVARAVLPEGNTVSKLFINGTIRSWVHYCLLRTDIATQKEHREVALACANAINKIFPKQFMLSA